MEQEFKFRFDYDITSNCNLNCAGCSHYSPLCIEENLSVEQADQELKSMSDFIKGECEAIRIMGGEPLLNPNLLDILKLARLHFPSTQIFLITNGILLGTIEPVFWKTCYDLNIAILVTVYPIKLTVDKINTLSKVFKVPILYFRSGEYFTRYSLDEKGLQNIKTSFENCRLHGCVYYRNGRLYPCTLPGCVDRLNKYFDKHFVNDELNSIAIEAETKKEDVIKLLNNPIPFCKYCMVEKWNDDKNLMKWSVSKREAKEWINEQ